MRNAQPRLREFLRMLVSPPAPCPTTALAYVRARARELMMNRAAPSSFPVALAEVVEVEVGAPGAWEHQWRIDPRRHRRRPSRRRGRFPIAPRARRHGRADRASRRRRLGRRTVRECDRDRCRRGGEHRRRRRRQQQDSGVQLARGVPSQVGSARPAHGQFGYPHPLALARTPPAMPTSRRAE